MEKEEIIKAIDKIISELNERDVAHHIYWGKFKHFIEVFPESKQEPPKEDNVLTVAKYLLKFTENLEAYRKTHTNPRPEDIVDEFIKQNSFSSPPKVSGGGFTPETYFEMATANTIETRPQISSKECLALMEDYHRVKSLPAKQQEAPNISKSDIDKICDIIQGYLTVHTMKHCVDDDDNAFPLLDLLTPRKDKNITRGKEEIENIVTGIYYALYEKCFINTNQKWPKLQDDLAFKGQEEGETEKCPTCGRDGTEEYNFCSSSWHITNKQPNNKPDNN